MPKAHRNDDLRNCTSKTIVSNQSSVTIEGELWAVEGDENDHGGGELISIVGSDVTIEGKLVIVVGDTASPDDLLHEPPLVDPSTGSDSVSCY